MENGTVRRLHTAGTCLILGCVLVQGCQEAARTDSAAEEQALPAVPPELIAGRDTYVGSCASCHDTSRDGAPRLGYLAAWSRRLENGEDELVQNAIDGLDLMPPRGDNPELTDDQIADTVRYMIYRAKLDIPAKH